MLERIFQTNTETEELEKILGEVLENSEQSQQFLKKVQEAKLNKRNYQPLRRLFITLRNSFDCGKKYKNTSSQGYNTEELGSFVEDILISRETSEKRNLLQVPIVKGRADSAASKAEEVPTEEPEKASSENMVSIKLPILSEADKIEEHLNAIDSWFDLQTAGTVDTDAKKRNFLKFSISNVKSVYTIYTTEIADTDTYAQVKTKLKKFILGDQTRLIQEANVELFRLNINQFGTLQGLYNRILELKGILGNDISDNALQAAYKAALPEDLSTILNAGSYQSFSELHVKCSTTVMSNNKWSQSFSVNAIRNRGRGNYSRGNSNRGNFSRGRGFSNPSFQQRSGNCRSCGQYGPG